MLSLQASPSFSDGLPVHQATPLESAPVWDEVAGCFWCPTSVNAYNIPDGIEWKETFHKALIAIEPGFFEARDSVCFELTNLDLPPARISTPRQFTTPETKENRSSRSASPVTPKKPIRKPTWLKESPRTPPLARATSPRTRRLRATHTKALIGMKEKAGMPIVVQGRELALFRLGGQVFAVSARCPHQGGNLCEGEVGDIEDLVMEGSQPFVTCPVHKMQFNLRDGSVMNGHCNPLQTYKVRVSEVDVHKKVAMVEVGFDSLADTYFDEVCF